MIIHLMQLYLKGRDSSEKMPHKEKHFLHIYYGNGKGKTTCAIGMAIRALGADKRVTIIQFDKGYDGKYEHYSERNILRKLKNLTLIPTGCERITKNGKFRFGALEKDRKEADRALRESEKAIEKGSIDLLILDEALSAVTYKLVTEEQLFSIMDLWKKRSSCELVLTGRCSLKKIIKMGDLVTEMRLVKHYFYGGVKARKGIEF